MHLRAAAVSYTHLLLYCNGVGIQNNGKNIFTFDGCSTFYTKEGNVLIKKLKRRDFKILTDVEKLLHRRHRTCLLYTSRYV